MLVILLEKREYKRAYGPAGCHHETDAARGKQIITNTSLSGHNHLRVDKQPLWGGVMPLKTLSRVLEEKLLMVLVAKEMPSLFLPCSGVPLNLIPMTLERVNDRALDVSKGSRRNLIS